MIAALYFSGLATAWTAIAAVGVVIAAVNVLSAVGDIRAVGDSNGSGERNVVAVYFIIAEIVRLVVQLIFVTIGFCAMTLPPLPHMFQLHGSARVFSLVLQWGLMTAAVLIVFQSLTALVMRLALTGRV